MKIQRFVLPDQMDAWEALECMDGVTIEHRYLVSPGGDWKECIYVLYRDLDELADIQKLDLDVYKQIAAQVENDKVLPTLKNATQRELYFLEVYNVDSYTAGRVWEYLKMKEKVKEIKGGQ